MYAGQAVRIDLVLVRYFQDRPTGSAGGRLGEETGVAYSPAAHTA